MIAFGRMLAAPALALLLAGCASAPPPPPAPEPAAAAAFDPTGVFDFRTQFGGQPATGEIRITRQPTGELGGSLSTYEMGRVPFRTVTVEGNRVTATTSTPEGQAVLRLVLEGETFTGDWSYAGYSGAMTGQRRN
jgi:hypothetical protein